MRTTIFRKGLLLIAVPLLFQLAFVALLARILSEAADAEKWAIHSVKVNGVTERAFGKLSLMQGAIRGYVISENKVYLDDFTAARDLFHQRIEQFLGYVSDNPRQQARVQAIRDAVAEWNQWQDSQIERIQTGRREDAVRRIGEEIGRSKLQHIRALFDELLAEESRLADDRNARLNEARREERWAIGGGTAGMVLVTLFAAWWYSRSIASRLAVVTSNAERLAGGEPLAARLNGHDEIARLDEVVHLTWRRLAEADAHEKLFAAELESRATELARTNESLRQQTQENEMFVYSVSHDLRSPLVNLQGFSKELEHACRDLEQMLSDPGVPAELRERGRDIMTRDVHDSLRFIQTAVSRSSGIIDALLRLSRAGRVEYRWQEVDVTSVVQRVLDAMHGTISERGATIRVRDLAPAWGDPTAIEQLFGNLIGNAVNYLDSTRPGLIEVGMLNGGSPDESGRRTYYVKDNGLGIPAAYLHKIFVAFQRLHGDVAKGEGIGLALVRRMVERHGGRIHVESVEGEGTTFFVTLWAKAPPADALTEPAASAAPAGHS